MEVLKELDELEEELRKAGIDPNALEEDEEQIMNVVSFSIERALTGKERDVHEYNKELEKGDKSALSKRGIIKTVLRGNTSGSHSPRPGSKTYRKKGGVLT